MNKTPLVLFSLRIPNRVLKMCPDFMSVLIFFKFYVEKLYYILMNRCERFICCFVAKLMLYLAFFCVSFLLRLQLYIVASYFKMLYTPITCFFYWIHFILLLSVYTVTRTNKTFYRSFFFTKKLHVPCWKTKIIYWPRIFLSLLWIFLMEKTVKTLVGRRRFNFMILFSQAALTLLPCKSIMKKLLLIIHILTWDYPIVRVPYPNVLNKKKKRSEL